MGASDSVGKSIVPGAALCLFLAGVSMWLGQFKIPGLPVSPMLVVILLGMAIATVVSLPVTFEPGLQFATKPLLRWGVAFLGLRLSFSELAAIGTPSLAAVTVGTGMALLAAWVLGKVFKLGFELTSLLGVGGAICGASAVVAADSVVQSEKGEAPIALAVVTLWGTVGIFVFPILGHSFQLSDAGFGLWSGAALQETAQVVAAAEGFSKDTVALATTVKLARICLLAPVIFGLAWIVRSRSGEERKASVQVVPWFLFVFLVLAGLRTVGPGFGITAEQFKSLDPFVTFVLAAGMAGVGLKSRLQTLVHAGLRPIGFGLAQWLVLSLVALGLAQALG